MSEIDQQFIEYVVKSLVGKPDAVKVDRRVDEKGVLLELTVDPEDLGRVIGKRGATAQSLRTLLRALGTKNDARYNLKIIDNGVGPHARRDDDTPASDDHPQDDNRPIVAEPDQPAAVVDEPSEESRQEPNSEPEPAEERRADEPAELEENTSERLRQTREELADLDDLDV